MKPGGLGSVSGASGSRFSYSINRSTETRSFSNSADLCIPYENSSPRVRTEEMASPADDAPAERKILQDSVWFTNHPYKWALCRPSDLRKNFRRVIALGLLSNAFG